MNKVEELMQAIKASDLTRVKELIAIDPSLIQAKTVVGVSMLMLATYYGRGDIVKFFLAQKPLLDIFQAAAVGEIETVSDWVARQPNLVNAFAVDGFTPLGLAAFFGHADVVEFLLAHGADPNIPSNNDQRVAPLNSAAAGAHLEIARLLVDHGANVNAKQEGGFVPLHNAAQNGQVEMIELLLAHQADVNVKADDGKTPLEYAIEHKRDHAAQLLKRQGARSEI